MSFSLDLLDKKLFCDFRLSSNWPKLLVPILQIDPFCGKLLYKQP